VCDQITVALKRYTDLSRASIVTDPTPSRTPEESVLFRTAPKVRQKVERLLAERDAWNALAGRFQYHPELPAFGPALEGWLSDRADEAGVRVPSVEDKRYVRENFEVPVEAERAERARLAKAAQDEAIFAIHTKIHDDAEGGIVATHGPELHGAPPARTSSQSRYWAVGAHGHFHDHSGPNPTGRPEPGWTAREYSEEEAEARLTKLRVAELRRKKP
jgi:hypothetical protein